VASVRKRLPANALGDFYVDSTCIDCGTCRWVAPASFDAHGDASRVYCQPGSTGATHRALMAVLACPVAAIGTTEKHDLDGAYAAFPDPIDGNVYHCGYHSAESYGAASYLIVRPKGNVLVDSPRFTKPLVRRLEELGGVALMFLTHRDDVADHRKFHEHFGCPRILHRADVGGPTRGVEIQPEGVEPIDLDPELTLIPVPGHTRGSMCLRYRERYLFSGDHLAWDASRKRLVAWRDVCWYDWDEQTESMARLTRYRFEWVLPGHGRRAQLPAREMAVALRDLVGQMGGRPRGEGGFAERRTA
jgi:glyoxylase-like metal-dependent hydrolase (beta-lactamase superfamily II)/ferredoxin